MKDSMTIWSISNLSSERLLKNQISQLFWYRFQWYADGWGEGETKCGHLSANESCDHPKNCARPECNDLLLRVGHAVSWAKSKHWSVMAEKYLRFHHLVDIRYFSQSVASVCLLHMLVWIFSGFLTSFKSGRGIWKSWWTMTIKLWCWSKRWYSCPRFSEHSMFMYSVCWKMFA